MKPNYRYVDAKKVTAQLDELIKQPICSINKEALQKYETEYYGKKCKASYEMVERRLR